MKGNQVLAYRLHSPDGALLYSANPASADATEPPSEAFDVALSGEVGVELVTAADDPVVPADAGTVMKVYAPVARGDGEVIAVADIYKPYEPVAGALVGPGGAAPDGAQPDDAGHGGQSLRQQYRGQGPKWPEPHRSGRSKDGYHSLGQRHQG